MFVMLNLCSRMAQKAYISSLISLISISLRLLFGSCLIFLQKGWYRNVTYLGKVGDLPILTLT